jgi:capsular exopolysaccharide synthesis family protein
MEYEKINIDQSDENFIRIQDLLVLFISKWRWFVASLFITLSFAALYIMTTPPVYISKASILIKDESKKGRSINNAETFSSLGLIQSNININNELFTLKSPILIADVVRRLKLDMNYALKGYFRDQVLYNQTPVIVALDSTGVRQSFTCSIKLLPDNKVTLFNFTSREEKFNSVIEGELFENLQTPFGSMKIIATSFYSEDYYGKQILFSKFPIESVANVYMRRLNAEISDKEATVIDFALSDVSLQRAIDVLNTLIDEYNKNWVEDKNIMAVSMSGFIDDRLAIIEDELGNVDKVISQFKSTNLIPDIHMASNMYMVRSGENNVKIMELETQRYIAQYILEHLQDSIGKEQFLPLNLGLDNGGIDGQISEYNRSLSRKNNFLQNSSENNPLIVDLNNSLESLRKSILTSISNLIFSLNTQIASLNQSDKQTSQRIASSPDQEKYLTSVQRQQKVKETLYLFLLQKREENELSQAFVAYNTKIIANPSRSPIPIAPRKPFLALIAFSIGILLPGLVFFLRETLNTSVRGRKDLEALSIPFIGEIPQIQKKGRQKMGKGKNTSGTDIVMQEKDHGYMSEAFRLVRTNIDFMKGVSEKIKVMMFTSFNVGSGKTFTTINLAMSMAIKGKKVIAIDLDMRKTSLSKYVDSPKEGISNYLSGMSDNYEKLIIKGALHPHLDIMPVGAIPPNPVELLLGDRLSNLLDSLRQEYDYIFLDCTPVVMLSDSVIVGKLADLTLFIIRAGLMDRRLLPDVEAIYKEAKFKHMAVLLNGATVFHRKYGYHQYGYYRYGETKDYTR